MIEATNISNEIIQIYLADGTAKNVRVDSHTTVQRVVNVVLNGLGLDQFSTPHFALRLAPAASVPGTKLQQQCHWLHPNLRMPQISQKYLRRPNPIMPLRFELKIRFIPKDIREMYQTEMSAFLYFYDQLAGDYINHVAWKIETDIAVEMGSLMLKKRFPNITVSNVEKRLDFRVIEQEGGLLKYFPESYVLNVKKKQLQKNIIAAVKRIANYSELECVFRFLNQLMKIVKFDAEIFRVSLGLGWHSPIELHIGEKAGISYKTENSTALIQLAKLRSVVDICIRRLDNSDKAIVRLRISAQANPLILTVPTMAIAESMAHLIDGYQMLLSQQPSLWSVQDLFMSENNTSIAKTRRAQTLSPQIQRNHYYSAASSNSNNHRVPLTPNFNRSGPTFDQNHYYYSRESNSEDYAKSMISESEFHLDRSSVRLEELVGDGLFGNVYRGSYIDTRLKRHSVAVKVCRVDNDTQDLHTSNKFLLEEAYTMQQFRHPHIIKLLGICTGPSISSSDESESDSGTASNNNNNEIPLFGVWMVMELAPFGELRQYLQREKSIIDLSVQILFAKQIASAVTYLHTKAFVHRDIAARNVLVTNSRCVKLSDFGMSKLLAEEDVYTSSSGKLPIKWMAPESLNFRKFTTQSDVYSLGVCIWEILMHGIKPWQGIRNHEVIKKIEAGELLSRPAECPLAVYDMLRAMWVIDEYLRITAIETTHFLEHLLEEIDNGKRFSELTVPDFHTLRKKIDALPKSTTPINGRKKSIPILNIDASEVPISTLWRAMESQRQQCEEDEKWLEGGCENQQHFQDPSTSTKVSPVDDLLQQQQQKSAAPSPPPLPHDVELDRASDSIHEAVLRVVQAVTYLTKTYSTQMTNNEFVEKIKKITNELSQLFSESEKDIQKLSNEDRKKVEMVEALLGTDLRNMTKAMSHVVDENEKVKCDYHRRQVLKTAHMLAVNCKNYLDTVDEARIRAGIARLCCSSTTTSRSPNLTPSFC